MVKLIKLLHSLSLQHKKKDADVGIQQVSKVGLGLAGIVSGNQFLRGLVRLITINILSSSNRVQEPQPKKYKTISRG